MSEKIDVTEIHDLLQEISDHAVGVIESSFNNDNNPDTKLCVAINQCTLIAEKTKRLLEIFGDCK